MDKIVYIANARIPTQKANGKQIVKTCFALAKLGVPLELYLPTREQTPALAGQTIESYYAVKQNFKTDYLFSIDFLYKATNWPHFFSVLAYVLQEASFIVSLLKKNYSNKVIYTRSLTAAVVLKKLKAPKAVFYEMHNFTTRALLQILYTRLLNSLNGSIAISQGLAQQLGSLGVTAVHVVPDAVDNEEFFRLTKKFARRELNLSPRLYYAVYAGSGGVGKGVETLIQASEQLPRDVRVLLVGDIPRPKKTPKNIDFTDFVPPQQVPLYLCAADLLLLPGSGKSLYTRLYTSPMKLFEYLASGTPIIATSTPANLEVLNSDNSLLIPPDSPAKMTEAIKKLLANTNLATKLAAQAKKDAKKYTWEMRAKKILAFIKMETS